MQHGNTVVVLPTGAGKTLIAAEVALQKGAPILFLVPTCLLVAQQAEAMADWTGMRVGQYSGGLALPLSFDILVSTPKAFQVAQSRGMKTLAWSSFRLVVFDEVHHVLKEHPYRKLAQELRSVATAPPQVLGLTASLTYAVGANKVKAAIAQLCRDLQIARMTCAESSEMAAEGYNGTCAAVELRPADIPGAALAGITPPEQRKPHLMVQSFFCRVKQKEALPFSSSLVALIGWMEMAVQAADPSFKSPLSSKSVKEWGAHAHALRERNKMCAELEHWYEALRILVVSWEEAQDAALTFLQMNGVKDAPSGQWPQSLQTQITEFWRGAPAYFPRFEHLKDVLLYKHDELSSFRGLIFVQQRVMTHILEHVVRNDPELSSRFVPACLYATSSPATASLAVNAQQSRERLAAFARGSVNLLITTVVAEEGMDVPEANCVIRFDPLLNSVSFVQGRGRARQSGSSHVILAERPDRPAALLAEVEQQQLSIVRAFQPSQQNKGDNEQARRAQSDRERGAASALAAWDGAPTTALAAVNLFCKKTKVDLAEQTRKDGAQFICELAYQSVLRDVCVMGNGADPKSAKREAAAKLVQQLKAGGRA